MQQGREEVTTPTVAPASEGRAQNQKQTCPQRQQVSLDSRCPPPAASSLSPDLPCPPHHSRAAETTTGPVSGGGRGALVSRGGEDGWTPEPRPCPSSLRPQPLPDSLPTAQRGAEAGVRPGVKGGLRHHNPSSPTCHMRGGGQPAGESYLGLSYSASPQALTGVSRETERPAPHPDTWLRLVGWEAGLCDPGPVTEPFCPSAEKGSLVPESHWGSKAQGKNRAVSTLLDSPLSTRPRKGGGKCHPESKEERPPSPHHGLGDPFLLPTATLRCDLKCGKQNKASPWTEVSHLSAV